MNLKIQLHNGYFRCQKHAFVWTLNLRLTDRGQPLDFSRKSLLNIDANCQCQIVMNELEIHNTSVTYIIYM